MKFTKMVTFGIGRMGVMIIVYFVDWAGWND